MPEIDFNDLKRKITHIQEYLSLSNNKKALAHLDWSNHQHSLKSANKGDEAKKRRRKSKELKTEIVPGRRIRVVQPVSRNNKSWAWRKFGVQIEKMKDANTLYYRKNTELIEEIERLTQDLITKCNDVFPGNISLYEKASKLLGYIILYDYIIESAYQNDVDRKTLLKFPYEITTKGKAFTSRNQLLSHATTKLIKLGLLFSLNKNQEDDDHREKLFSLNDDLFNKIYNYSNEVTSLFEKYKC